MYITSIIIIYELHNGNKTEKNHYIYFSIDRALVMVFIYSFYIRRVWVHIIYIAMHTLYIIFYYKLTRLCNVYIIKTIFFIIISN